MCERTVRPLALRLAGIFKKFTSDKKVGRTEKRRAMAGDPGNLRTNDFLGMKAACALVVAGITVLVLGVPLNNWSFASFAGPALGMIEFFAPEF